MPIKLEFSASVGFTHKEFDTMHGHTILKIDVSLHSSVSGNSLLEFSYPTAYYKLHRTVLLLSCCRLEYLITTQRYCELHSQWLYLNTVTSYGHGRT
jgi:hypothetical protein